MATQRLKGLWVPAEILLNEELTDIVNVTADRVSKIISSLREKRKRI